MAKSTLYVLQGYESRFQMCNCDGSCGECVEYKVLPTKQEKQQSKPANTYNGVTSKQYRRNARNRKASRV